MVELVLFGMLLVLLLLRLWPRSKRCAQHHQGKIMNMQRQDVISLSADSPARRENWGDWQGPGAQELNMRLVPTPLPRQDFAIRMPEFSGLLQRQFIHAGD